MWEAQSLYLCFIAQLACLRSTRACLPVCHVYKEVLLFASEYKDGQDADEQVLDDWLVVHNDGHPAHAWQVPAIRHSYVLPRLRQQCNSKSNMCQCVPYHAAHDVIPVQPLLAFGVQLPLIVVAIVCIALFPLLRPSVHEGGI